MEIKNRLGMMNKSVAKVIDDHPPNLWIAEDPSQPGTAFAWASTRHDQTETLAEWLSVYGVRGRMVNREDALHMLDLWDKNKTTLLNRDRDRVD